MSKKHRINPTIPVAKLQAMAKDPTFLFSFDDKRSLHRDNLSRERTLADRRHDPPPPLAAGDAAADVRRDGPGAGGGQGRQERDIVTVASARGQMPCVAIVTDRFKPMTVMGVKVHTLGMPWCYGWRFPRTAAAGTASTC